MASASPLPSEPSDSGAVTAPRDFSDRPVRVLVVDDSATVRSVLTRRLAKDVQFEVVGSAKDGLDALAQIKSLKPDVITLDIEMPRLDGLAMLERLMRERPTRVVMVSSLTREGADATVRALELGAVDFIEKPVFGGVPDTAAVADEVATKVRQAAMARLVIPSAAPAADRGKPRRGRPPSAWLPKKVVFGSSTGGPQALRRIVTSLPGDLGVPVVAVQHMPAGFTRSLAERLDELSAVRVEEAGPGSRLEPGKVLLAPGGRHLTIDGDGVVSLNDDEPECGVRPAINVTVESMVDAYGGDVVAVVLTGMGTDGTRGSGLVKEAGGRVFVEAEESCVVWGMPRSVQEAGYADRVLAIDDVARAVVGECLMRSARRPTTVD